MYLKRIVLHGFKSFADRTEFEFGPGITCVVGPNGCGKSNLLDAVRWVLGSQSPRRLRGKKMEDVIFAGSRTRKPANAAQVELVFDNRTGFLATDQSEVSVARVLYRSGDSEYRLNGKTCRLKDIKHLFLDTGVGVDAYSIIEQGRVDLLLQADPLQRREIFEEAAGISRYKVQRAEAQRKLERAQNNLLRLNDVLEELERRLRSVKLAAGKARRWREYDARLRELRASFSLAEYHDLECGRQEVAARLAEIESHLQAERSALAAKDAEAAERQCRLQQLDEQIQALDEELAALQSEHSTLTERIAQGERRCRELAQLRERRLAQEAELTERLAGLERRVAEEEASLEALREAAERSAGRISELQAAHGQAARRRDDSRRSLEQARSAAFEAVRRSALLRSECNALLAERDRLRAQAERMTDRLRTLEEEQRNLACRRAEMAAEAAQHDARAADLARELRAVEAHQDALKARLAELDQEIGRAKERRSALLSRLELLADMEQRLEGVAQGTRTVLAWREEPGLDAVVLGLVADLLRIDDPRVSILQPVLATFEDHVVVADTYALLAELERHEPLPGPLRVIALDRVPGHTPRDDYDRAPGFVARALDWVRCRPELRPLAEHLLGRVIIVDELERALAWATGAPEGYLFVSLDGRVVSADGRLTAAAGKTGLGLISRKAEIRRLEQQRDEVETALERCFRARAEVEQEASDAQVRRSALLDRIAEVQRAHAELRSGLTRVEAEIGRLERERGLLDSELSAVRRSVVEAETRAAELDSQTAEAGVEQETRQSQITSLERELAELDRAVNALAAELTEAKVAAGRVAEKRAAGEETLAQLRDRRSALERERDEARREAEESAKQIGEAEAEASAARTRLSECMARLEGGRAEVLSLRERRQALRAEIEQCGAEIRAVDERIRSLEEQRHEATLAGRELEVRRENLVARVQDELGLDLVARYAGYEHAEQDWEAVKQEIAELREKLARLGNVNLDALAELEELEPRYEHMVSQRADLLASIERLEKLIAELDRESQTRFAATFAQVRENFHELFRQLFGGGKADVLLEDPERPLECGIEIIARPPGKELQSISLLSGGEKTLTAVALLMAVFKSKPSPFAFLDEVDAALDEANIERFNTMLQGFLAHSQFVVITHSKRTMQSADALYGVTMEEPGVSKRVSVRFNDERVKTPSVA